MPTLARAGTRGNCPLRRPRFRLSSQQSTKGAQSPKSRDGRPFMEYLLDQLWNILYLAQAAFTIWMLVDAYRRGAEYYWYLIIFMVPVVGAWVYFFVHKAGDYRWLRDMLHF